MKRDLIHPIALDIQRLTGYFQNNNNNNLFIIYVKY